MKTTKKDRSELKPLGKTGTCELCGGHGRELRVLVLPDWIGWSCDECREQIMKCYMGQIQSAAGHSEPAE